MDRPDETWHRLLNWTYGQAPSERLAAQILLASGFAGIDPSHPLGGPDGGKDAVCTKDGQRWIMAVYFPRGKQSFANINKKFKADLAGIVKNSVTGIAFVTNQELTLSERATLKKLCKTTLLDVFHLERIAMVLEEPRMVSVRQRYLYIDPTLPATASGLLLASDWSTMLQGKVDGDTLEIAGQAYPLLRRTQQGSGVSIASLLTWSSRIPEKLVGRECELADLQVWAEQDGDMRLRVLWGGGGVGKTRLTFEFGETLRAKEWATCLIGASGQASAFQPGATGTLLIIDYPEYQPKALQNLLRFFKSQTYPSGRWRILLLSRNRDIEQQIDDEVPNLRDNAIQLAALATSEFAWELFGQASAQMRALLPKTHTSGAITTLSRTGFDTWLGRDPHHADPLIILAFALNLLYEPGALTLGRADILQRLVMRERGRIKHALAAYPDVQFEGAILLKALAALNGGLGKADVEEAKTRLQDSGIVLPNAVALMRTEMWQDDILPKMQPDILAAELSTDP